MHDLARAHLDTGEQHQEKHTQIGDRYENFVVVQIHQGGKGNRVFRDNRAQGDTGDKFTNQGRLAQAFGGFTKGPRRHQQYEQDKKQIHTRSGLFKRKQTLILSG